MLQFFHTEAFPEKAVHADVCIPQAAALFAFDSLLVLCWLQGDHV